MSRTSLRSRTATVCLVAAATLMSPSAANAASVGGSGYTCTPSSTGYYAHISSTSRGWVVHETQGPYTSIAIGYRANLTYGNTGHKVSSITWWEAKGTDSRGTSGAVTRASSACGPY